MSIKIQPCVCTSDDRVVNKELTAIGLELTVTMKEDCSIIDPVFILSGGVSTFANCNYVTTTGLGGRQYFVRDIRTNSNGLTELHCHVDVLSTWAADLGSMEAVLERQQEEFNLYLDDGSFKVYSNPIIQTLEFTSGFSSPCYILGVVGG